ncbi:MAG: Transcriptional regulator, HxlR family, partial [uncultured Acidimicrobiales bacterium]
GSRGVPARGGGGAGGRPVGAAHRLRPPGRAPPLQRPAGRRRGYRAQRPEPAPAHPRAARGGGGHAVLRAPAPVRLPAHRRRSGAGRGPSSPGPMGRGPVTRHRRAPPPSGVWDPVRGPLVLPHLQLRRGGPHGRGECPLPL